jgi:LPS-assembly lipoprotein
MIARHTLLLASAFLLTACGFHTVYGSHGDQNSAVTAGLGDIAIENIPDRPGQILKNDLIDRMYSKGRPVTPHYRLKVMLSSSEADLGIQADATSTRAQLNTTGEYTLTDLAGKKLASGMAHSVSNFDTLDQQFSTQAAREAATERTIDEVSNQIVNALSLYFANLPAKKPE